MRHYLRSAGVVGKLKLKSSSTHGPSKVILTMKCWPTSRCSGFFISG